MTLISKNVRRRTTKSTWNWILTQILRPMLLFEKQRPSIESNCGWTANDLVQAWLPVFFCYLSFVLTLYTPIHIQMELFQINFKHYSFSEFPTVKLMLFVIECSKFWCYDICILYCLSASDRVRLYFDICNSMCYFWCTTGRLL